VDKPYGFGRCRNCSKRYEKIQRHQNFCSPSCRKEFHRHDGISASTIKRFVNDRLTEEQIGKIVEVELQKANRKIWKRLNTDPPEELISRLANRIADMIRRGDLTLPSVPLPLASDSKMEK
jgi:hypothetical protein